MGGWVAGGGGQVSGWLDQGGNKANTQPEFELSWVEAELGNSKTVETCFTALDHLQKENFKDPNYFMLLDDFNNLYNEILENLKPLYLRLYNLKGLKNMFLK